MDELLDASLRALEQRVERGIYYGTPDAPRVLVTGCPVAGDAATVFRVIEEAGGVIVAIDSCAGMKSFMDEIEENTGDPIGALTRRYLKIACACMTPNVRRLTELDRYMSVSNRTLSLTSCFTHATGTTWSPIRSCSTSGKRTSLS